MRQIGKEQAEAEARAQAGGDTDLEERDAEAHALAADVHGAVDETLGGHLKHAQQEAQRDALLLGETRPALQQRRPRV